MKSTALITVTLLLTSIDLIQAQFNAYTNRPTHIIKLKSAMNTTTGKIFVHVYISNVF